MSTSYFGRAWKVTVTPKATVTAAFPYGEEWTVSNSEWEPEALKCTFQIHQQALETMWFADIVLYNFLPSLQQVIQAGDLVTVTAGYQSPGTGVIFSGKVFQPLWERSSETDYTLTLHCLVGLWDQTEPNVSVVIPANVSADKAVRLVADAAIPAIKIDSLDPALALAPKNPRATSFNGPPTLFFAQTAKSANLNFWMSYNGVTIRSLAPETDVPDLVYLPPYSPTAQLQTNGGLTKYTLIGTPQQTEDGLNFRVLLDTDIALGKLAQITSTVVKKLALYPGQKLFIDPDGIYVVAGITHIGDTRGNEWYSEIHAITRPLSKMLAVMAR